MIHFHVSESVDLDGLEEWDPDADPSRFATGVGHNLLELHRRLHRRGLITTVGPVVPPQTTLVVMMPWPILNTDRGMQLRCIWRLRRHRVVMVRSDLPISLKQPLRTDVVVAPSRSFIQMFGSGDMCFLPPLPQRGLLARDVSRGDQIATVAIKSNPENVPKGLSSPKMVERLRALGVTLEIDAPGESSGSDQQWHDFRSVDVALCVRLEEQETISKPATKLRNAWAAGVIPLASREPAYVEIATDRHDVLFFDDLDEIPDLIRSLHEDSELREQMWRGVAQSASAQPNMGSLVDAWWELLTENEGKPSSWRGFQSLLFLVRRGLSRLVEKSLRRLLRFREARRAA